MAQSGRCREFMLKSAAPKLRLIAMNRSRYVSSVISRELRMIFGPAASMPFVSRQLAACRGSLLSRL